MRILLLSLVALSSCLHRGDHIEYEKGVVLTKKLTPGYYHTYTVYERQYYGRTYKGHRQYINIPRTRSYYVEPVYTTTFKCEHEKIFDINREDIYNAVSYLDTVTIEFYNLLDGKEQIKDYDFITAYRQKQKHW